MNDDDLKKLGLRVRPRIAGQQRNAPETRRRASAGRISFDDLGNAVCEWRDESLAKDSEHTEYRRGRALQHPGLSLMDDDAPAHGPMRPNAKGLRLGYNPYESGLLAKKEWKKKRDLRELSKWIETKRKVYSRPPEEE